METNPEDTQCARYQPIPEEERADIWDIRLRFPHIQEWTPFKVWYAHEIIEFMNCE